MNPQLVAHYCTVPGQFPTALGSALKAHCCVPGIAARVPETELTTLAVSGGGWGDADGGRANPQLEPAYAQPQIVCVDHLAMLPSLAGCGKLDSVWQMGKMQTSSFSW